MPNLSHAAKIMLSRKLMTADPRTLTLQVHDVSQTSAGGKLMESAAKLRSEKSIVPPRTGGTDAFSLSDEEDERPAKADGRWLGLLHDSNPWKVSDEQWGTFLKASEVQNLGVARVV
jgi:hypothetical protein